MREEYYYLLQMNGISDIFCNLTDISYSKKIKILNGLLKQYDIKIINIALEIYKKEYINKDRIYYPTLENTLKNICNTFEEEEI